MKNYKLVIGCEYEKLSDIIKQQMPPYIIQQHEFLYLVSHFDRIDTGILLTDLGDGVTRHYTQEEFMKVIDHPSTIIKQSKLLVND